MAARMLEAPWGLAIEMPIAQIFVFKHPQEFLELWRGRRGTDCAEHPLLHTGLCYGTCPRHVGLAEPAVATSVCHSQPVSPELINKTSGVILAPGPGLSPGAQSGSFSVSRVHCGSPAENRTRIEPGAHLRRAAQRDSSHQRPGPSMALSNPAPGGTKARSEEKPGGQAGEGGGGPGRGGGRAG